MTSVPSGNGNLVPLPSEIPDEIAGGLGAYLAEMS
jgi:hypothetical protein